MLWWYSVNWHMSKQGSTAMPCSSRCHHYGDNQIMVVGLPIEIWSWTGNHLVTQQCCQTGWDSSTLIPALQVSDISQYFYMKVCAQIAAKLHTFLTSETDSDGPDNMSGSVLTILTLGTWILGHKNYVVSITVELHLSRHLLSDWLGPSGKFVENSTKLTRFEITH
jgi:hypothetical protein